MVIVQRIVSAVFGLFLWLVAFSAMESVTRDQQWVGLVSLIVGMLFMLFAIRKGAEIGDF